MMDNDRIFSVRKSPPPYEEAKNSEDFISTTKYQHWFDAIAADDVSAASRILESASSHDKQVLINAPFVYDNLQSVAYLVGNIKPDATKRPVFPLHIAFSFAAKNAADFLIKQGADVLKVDKNKRNILHSCITIGHYLPDREAAACDMLPWLKDRLNTECFVKLLLQENDDGLRPLEYAAQQCCLKLMQQIFIMDQNVKSDKIIGMGHFRLHCLTEYELGDRHAKSPINSLTYLDKSKLDDPSTVEVLLGPLFSEWISRKFKCNIIPIVLWFFVRMVGLMLYMVADLNVHWIEKIHGENASRYICEELSYVNIPDNQYLVLLSAGIVFLTFILISEVVDVVRDYKLNYNMASESVKGKKCVIHSNLFYRYTNVILHVSVLINISTYMYATLKGFPSDSFLVFIHILRGIVPLLCLSSFVYFLQLIPTLGSSVIQLKGMLTDIGQFMILFLIVMLPFVHVFEVFVLANSKHGCIHEFSSPMMTSYTLFRMMNNMVDTTAVEVNDIGVFYALHIIFVFIVAIMLINFLIAVMSNTAALISEQKDLVLTVNKLALVMTVENRLFWVSKWFYRRARKWCFHCKDDQVYLLSVKYNYPDIKGREKDV